MMSIDGNETHEEMKCTGRRSIHTKVRPHATTQLAKDTHLHPGCDTVGGRGRTGGGRRGAGGRGGLGVTRPRRFREAPIE
jgi:hypothetical protein